MNPAVWFVFFMCFAGLLNSAFASLWMQLGMTILVLAIIAAGAFFTVRFLKPKMGLGACDLRMSVIAKLSLEPRRSLYLVRVDDKEMVVGVTESGISVVTQIPSKEKKEDLCESSGGSASDLASEPPKEFDNAGE